MRVLATGVTGFLGGKLAETLARAGHEVRGFVREPSLWAGRPAGAEIVQGDLSGRGEVIEAATGCDAILHAAALGSRWIADRRQYDRVNVQGFGHVVDAARENRTRLIYVSSYVALGPTGEEAADEETPRATMEFQNDHERTRWVADQMARHLATTGLPIVRVYPGLVFGPGGSNESECLIRLLVDHARGRLAGSLGRGNRRQCLAYVDDVADGVLHALESAPDGTAYILGGENRTLRELFASFHSASGVAPPRWSSFATAALAGRFRRWRAKLLGIDPGFTDEWVRSFQHHWAYSSGRAARELGYRVTPFDEAVARTAEWLLEEGIL
jgi:farnesol dehydrogenase